MAASYNSVFINYLTYNVYYKKKEDAVYTFASRRTLIFRAILTVILCPVFMFHGIGRGIFNILLPGVAPPRGCLPVSIFY